MFHKLKSKLSITDIAKAYRISYESARYLVNSGRLKSIRKGKRRYVPKDELIYFLTHP